MNKTLQLASAVAFAMVFGAQATSWFDANIESYTEGGTPTAIDGQWDADWKSKMSVSNAFIVVDADQEDALRFEVAKTNNLVQNSELVFNSTVKFTPFTALPDYDISEAKAGVVLVTNDTDGIKFYGVTYDADLEKNVWTEIADTGVTDVDERVAVKVRFADEDGDTLAVYYTVGAGGLDNWSKAKAEDGIGGAQFIGSGEVASLKGENTLITHSLTIVDAGLAEKHAELDKVVQNPEGTTITPEGGVYKVAHGSTVTIYVKALAGYYYTGKPTITTGEISGDLVVNDFSSIEAATLYTAQVADEGSEEVLKYYETLNQAVAAATNTQVVTLRKDATEAGFTLSSNVCLTIEAGSALTLTAETSITLELGANILATDATAFGGTEKLVVGSGLKIEENTLISYTQWIAVKDEGGGEPVVPGEETPVYADSPEEAISKCSVVVPEGIEPTAYKALFKGSAEESEMEAGLYYVTFNLTEEAETTAVAQTDTAIKGLPITAAIGEAQSPNLTGLTPGLYYSISCVDALDDADWEDGEGDRVMADNEGKAEAVPMAKGAAGKSFYKVLINVTDK